MFTPCGFSRSLTSIFIFDIVKDYNLKRAHVNDAVVHVIPLRSWLSSLERFVPNTIFFLTTNGACL